MYETLVVCDTLKQADDLYRRTTSLIDKHPYYVRVHKGRLEIVIFGALRIRFTSDKRYRTVHQYGFKGKLIDGYAYEASLDSQEYAIIHKSDLGDNTLGKAANIFVDEQNR